MKEQAKKEELRQKAIEVASQLWCLPKHEHKTMDPDFCYSIVDALLSFSDKRVEELEQRLQCTRAVLKGTEDSSLLKSKKIKDLEAEVKDLDCELIAVRGASLNLELLYYERQAKLKIAREGLRFYANHKDNTDSCGNYCSGDNDIFDCGNKAIQTLKELEEE